MIHFNFYIFIAASLLFSQDKIHVSNNLLLQFKQSGNQRLAKSSVKNNLADTTNYFVRNIINQNKWDTIPFIKIARTENTIIWLEQSLPITSQQKITSRTNEIIDLIERRSSAQSVDSTKGMVQLTTELFGRPPDINSDKKFDVLLLDIRDGFLTDGAYVAGFFDPVDQSDLPNSNHRDIIYIDVFPGLIYNDTILSLDPALATLVHEFQHLVHFNYETDFELTFINEGLSEVSEILHGFAGRQSSLYLSTINQNFLSWGETTNILIDYQRASLFFYFLYERFDLTIFRDLCQDTKIGYQSLSNILALYGSNLEKEVEQFHLSNLLNGQSAEFRYFGERLKNIKTLDIESVSSLPYINHSIIEPGALVIFERNNRSFNQVNSTHKQPLHSTYIKDGKLSDDINSDYHVYFNSSFEKTIDHNFELFEPDTIFDYEFRYDDGVPDAVDGSKFLFQNGNIGSGFRLELLSPEFPIELRQIHIYGIFDNELSNDKLMQKRQYIEIGIVNGEVFYDDTLVWNRKEGVLGFETIRLKSPLYLEKNSLIYVQLENVDSNYLNIALDRSTEDSRSFLSYSQDSIKSFKEATYNQQNLKNYNAMLFLSGNVKKKINKFKYPQIKIVDDSIELDFNKNYKFIDAYHSSSTSAMSYKQISENKVSFIQDDLNTYFIEAITNQESDIYHFKLANYNKPFVDEKFDIFNLKSVKLDQNSMLVYAYKLYQNHYMDVSTSENVTYSVETTDLLMRLYNDKWRFTNSKVFYGSNNFRVLKDTIASSILSEDNIITISHVFPNPTSKSSSFYIQTSEETEFFIDVFNLIGQKVFAMKKEKLNVTEKISIDWTSLNVASGIYFIRISYQNLNRIISKVRKTVFFD